MATAQEIQTIAYNKDMDIRNVESLPSGRGARYLVVLDSPDNKAFIAKRWARVLPKSISIIESVIEFT